MVTEGGGMKREGCGVPVLIEPNAVGSRWLVQLLQMLGAHDDDRTLVRLRPFHGRRLDVVFFHEPVSGALACASACFRLPRVSRDVLVLVPWWYGMLILNGD